LGEREKRCTSSSGERVKKGWMCKPGKEKKRYSVPDHQKEKREDPRAANLAKKKKGCETPSFTTASNERREEKRKRPRRATSNLSSEGMKERDERSSGRGQRSDGLLEGMGKKKGKGEAEGTWGRKKRKAVPPVAGHEGGSGWGKKYGVKRGGRRHGFHIHRRDRTLILKEDWWKLRLLQQK